LAGELGLEDDVFCHMVMYDCAGKQERESAEINASGEERNFR
jgi:hypothetical protein